MKTALVLVALVVCLCGGVALGFGLGSAEVVRAVSPRIDTAARLDADDAPAPLESKPISPLDNRGLDVDRKDDELAALERRLEELRDEAEGYIRAEASKKAECEARIAELEAQLEDERMHRLNMVEEAIERRGLNRNDNSTGADETLSALLNEPFASTIYTPMTDASRFTTYAVILQSDFILRAGAPELEIEWVYPEQGEE